MADKAEVKHKRETMANFMPVDLETWKCMNS